MHFHLWKVGSPLMCFHFIIMQIRYYGIVISIIILPSICIRSPGRITGMKQSTYFCFIIPTCQHSLIWIKLLLTYLIVCLSNIQFSCLDAWTIYSCGCVIMWIGHASRSLLQAVQSIDLVDIKDVMFFSSWGMLKTVAWTKKDPASSTLRGCAGR